MELTDLERKKLYNKEYREKNLDRIKKREQSYRRINKERIKKKKAEYFQKNKKQISEKSKIYKEKNSEKIKDLSRKYWNNNKERIKTYMKEYNNKNREDLLQYYRDYYIINMEKIKTRKYAYQKEQYKKPEFRIIDNLRKRLKNVLKLKSLKKLEKSIELIGCSPTSLKNYLESKFTDGMSWESYGKNGWHIDHIIPCSSFNLSLLEEQKKCFHYTNLQPLWWWENLSKGNRLS